MLLLCEIIVGGQKSLLIGEMNKPFQTAIIQGRKHSPALLVVESLEEVAHS